MIEARNIQVRGIVQGVGFRPFVYRLARRYLINGWVLNATEGVFIHAEGDEKLLDEFVLEISQNPPAAARVDEIDIDYVPLQDFDTFEIRFSDTDEAEKTTLVSPDLATCEDCIAELFDPSDRRYHYPFINCTNCGPRFTIIDALPYDRASTSMRAFPMCDACAAEYGDPGDRRFHAQPDACFDCGPVLWFAVLPNGEEVDAAASAGTQSGSAPGGSPTEVGFAPTSRAISGTSETLADSSTASASDVAAGTDPRGVQRVAAGSPEPPSQLGTDLQVMWGRTRSESDAIIEGAVSLLRQGAIVAVKGLGGFHLACDASNPEALARLRRRKQREGKAFAVMVRDVEQAHRYCLVSQEEEALLASAARPIVLLRKRPNVQLAEGLADHLPELGVMLPATPVQHLLVRAFDGMLVMTSGNVHDEPIQIDDEQACDVLADIADAFLGNNRPIRARFDDSVVRVLDLGGTTTMQQFIRRARGYVPLPIGLPASLGVQQAATASPSAVAPFDKTAKLSVFATGPEQKCTFCFTRAGDAGQGTEAFVGQHIGDMENAEANDAWLEAKATYERLLQLHPTLVACDMHPEYLTSKWAASQDLPVVQVQHHHAHIVSAMAENKLEGPVCGIAFDGTGYGVDGALWGGEVLLANTRDFERFANFAYIPLPGGAAAIKHPLRCAYGALWAFDLLEHPAAASLLEALGDQAAVCEHMIETGLNTPYTSSVGRLFDAASALLGLCVEPTYEGEGAVLLESVLTNGLFVDAAASAGTRSAPAPGGSRTEVRFATASGTISGTSETLADSSTTSISNDVAKIDPRDVQRVAAGVSEPPSAADVDLLDPYPIDIVKNTASQNSTARDTSVVVLDAAPMFAAMLDDMQAQVPVALIARRFHDGLVAAIVQMAQLVEAAYGIATVVLSGGVFQNRYLMEHALPALAAEGFTVAVNNDLPPNDACISFGQAVVAIAQAGEQAR